MKTRRIETTPKRIALTYTALLALLALTFIAAHLNLGPFGTATGLLIAATKASLVILYFMEIRHESGVKRAAAALGIFWLGILVVLTLSDYLSRGWLLLPGPWPK